MFKYRIKTDLLYQKSKKVVQQIFEIQRSHNELIIPNHALENKGTNPFVFT